MHIEKMMFSKYYLYNTVESFQTNLGLIRKATYVWSFEEFIVYKHHIKDKAGSYGIYNSLNGKFYIGSAIDLCVRLMLHFHYANIRNSNVRLQHSLKKYGLVNFQIIIFDILPALSSDPRQDVVDLENALFQIRFVRRHRRRTTSLGRLVEVSSESRPTIPCKEKMYNFTYVADSSIGYRHTEQAKQLMSSQRSGSKNIAAIPLTLIDLVNNKTYELGTLKDAADIIGGYS